MKRRTTNLLVATSNQGKLSEFEEALTSAGVKILGLADIGIDSYVEETGLTFEANAESKARYYSELSGLMTLADDSGLEVDALNGEPGVHTARFGGDHLNDSGRRLLLLERVNAQSQSSRTARFCCSLALCDKNGSILFRTTKHCNGIIAFEERGVGGFGYDPIFIPEGHLITFAEMSPEEKSRISHRGKAMSALTAFLRSYLRDSDSADHEVIQDV
jgi:XTP/dITP diphosphohydrolase